MSTKIGAVIIAKNEEKFISKTIESLLDQDLKPYRIVLVDDGSTDKTSEIASKYPIEIIKRENRKEFLQGNKDLANTINDGLEKFQNDKDCDYIIKMDADIILPLNYISTITQRMNSTKIVVSSGVIEGESTFVPRGAGRVVQLDFWRKIGLKYPVNYGYERYLLTKAESIGYKFTVYRDLIMKTTRKTGSTYKPKMYYYYGLGLKANGYTIPFAMFRVLQIAKQKPLGAFYMLKGYLSNYQDLYESEVRDYLKKKQYDKIKRFDINIVKHFLFNKK